MKVFVSTGRLAQALEKSAQGGKAIPIPLHDEEWIHNL